MVAVWNGVVVVKKEVVVVLMEMGMVVLGGTDGNIDGASDGGGVDDGGHCDI